MAKRKLPEAARKYMFKPGQSGNPKGRVKNPVPDALKKMTKQQLRRVIRAIVKGNTDYLEQLANSKTASTLEVSVAVCYIKAMEKGDYGTIEHIIQRVVGKIPDELKITSNNKNLNVTEEISKIDDEKLKARMKAIRDAL